MKSFLFAACFAPYLLFADIGDDFRYCLIHSQCERIKFLAEEVEDVYPETAQEILFRVNMLQALIYD
jgi:hypothetical protein